MKEIILKLRTPLVGLVFWVVGSWLFLPYLFSNEKWEVQDEAIVQRFEVRERNIINEGIFFEGVMSDKDERMFELRYDRDVVDGSAIEIGDKVYVYQIGRTLCLSHQANIQDYKARWSYYFRCELLTVRGYVVFLLFAFFTSSVAIVIQGKRK